MSQHASKSIAVLYYPKEAAEMLRVDERTLAKWRAQGIGPAFIRISSRAVRYEESELQRFMAERTRQSNWDLRDSTAGAASRGGTREVKGRKRGKKPPGEILASRSRRSK